MRSLYAIAFLMIALSTVSCRQREEGSKMTAANGESKVGLHGKLVVEEGHIWLHTPLKNKYIIASDGEVMEALIDGADVNGNYAKLVGELKGDRYFVSEIEDIDNDRSQRAYLERPIDPGMPTTGRIYDFFYEPEKLKYALSIEHIFIAGERYVIPVPDEKAEKLAKKVDEYLKILGENVTIDKKPDCKGQPCRIEIRSDLSPMYFEKLIKDNPFPGENEVRITNPWPYQTKIDDRPRKK